MSILVFDRNIINRAPFYISQLEVDIDPIASRILLIERSTGLQLRHTQPIHNTFYLNILYSNSDNLIVMIIDDTRTYNAATLDGVTCNVVDGVALGL
jgi:hypothetical protein